MYGKNLGKDCWSQMKRTMQFFSDCRVASDQWKSKTFTGPHPVSIKIHVSNFVKAERHIPVLLTLQRISKVFNNYTNITGCFDTFKP